MEYANKNWQNYGKDYLMTTPRKNYSIQRWRSVQRRQSKSKSVRVCRAGNVRTRSVNASRELSSAVTPAAFSPVASAAAPSAPAVRLDSLISSGEAAGYSLGSTRVSGGSAGARRKRHRRFTSPQSPGSFSGFTSSTAYSLASSCDNSSSTLGFLER